MVRLTAYNLATVFFAATGGFVYGYGLGVFVSSVGYPEFCKYFGLDPEGEYTASILGAINGLFAFGAAMGALTQGWTSDWLGRKKAMFLSSIISIIGAALVAGSQAVSMIVVCRTLFNVIGEHRAKRVQQRNRKRRLQSEESLQQQQRQAIDVSLQQTPDAFPQPEAAMSAGQRWPDEFDHFAADPMADGMLPDMDAEIWHSILNTLSLPQET